MSHNCARMFLLTSNANMHLFLFVCTGSGNNGKQPQDRKSPPDSRTSSGNTNFLSSFSSSSASTGRQLELRPDSSHSSLSSSLSSSFSSSSSPLAQTLGTSSLESPNRSSSSSSLSSSVSYPLGSASFGPSSSSSLTSSSAQRALSAVEESGYTSSLAALNQLRMLEERAQPKNVTAQVGHVVYLHCVVEPIGDKMVSF